MRIVFLLIFSSLLLLSETINEQIHALETATPQERVELMNHIKEQLISMNEENRMQTLSKLRAKLQDKHEESHLETSQTYCKDNKNHQKGLHLKMHEGMMQSHEDNFRQMNERHQYLRQNNNNRERMEEQNRNEERREEQNRDEREVEYEGNNQEHNNGREP